MSAGSLRVSLWRALSGTLPNAEQTLLLRACLLAGGDSSTAWEDWRAGVADPFLALSDTNRWARSLLPLLMSAVSRSGAELNASTLSYLRAAFVREKLRMETYRNVRRLVLSSLEAQGLRPIVMKGAAFAETLYDTAEHRHCHDIDLLIRHSEARLVLPIIEKIGLSAVSSPEGTAHALFIHSSGLPLRAHTRPFLAHVYNPPVEELFERAKDCMLDGVAARILCPVDALVHLCGHASSVPGVDALRWVCDAFLLIGRAPDLDWDQLLERAVAMNVVVPLALRLDYLAAEFHAQVPAHVSQRLQNAAGDAPFSTMRAAFQGTLLSGRQELKRLTDAAADRRASAVLAVWAADTIAGRTLRNLKR